MKKITPILFNILVIIFYFPPGPSLSILPESVWEIALLNELILLKKDISTIKIVIENRIQEIVNRLLQ